MEYLPIQLPPATARAFLRGDEAHPALAGEVLFYPYGTGTLVVARAVGLPSPGFLAFHIHAHGVCAAGGDVSFQSAGGHFDNGSHPHPFHSGDLPPLLTGEDGVALLAVYTPRFRPAEVVGKTAMIHAVADDFRSQPAGDSGARLACGVIQAL